MIFNAGCYKSKSPFDYIQIKQFILTAVSYIPGQTRLYVFNKDNKNVFSSHFIMYGHEQREGVMQLYTEFKSFFFLKKEKLKKGENCTQLYNTFRNQAI